MGLNARRQRGNPFFPLPCRLLVVVDAAVVQQHATFVGRSIRPVNGPPLRKRCLGDSCGNQLTIVVYRAHPMVVGDDPDRLPVASRIQQVRDRSLQHRGTVAHRIEAEILLVALHDQPQLVGFQEVQRLTIAQLDGLHIPARSVRIVPPQLMAVVEIGKNDEPATQLSGGGELDVDGFSVGDHLGLKRATDLSRGVRQMDVSVFCLDDYRAVGKNQLGGAGTIRNVHAGPGIAGRLAVMHLTVLAAPEQDGSGAGTSQTLQFGDVSKRFLAPTV